MSSSSQRIIETVADAIVDNPTRGRRREEPGGGGGGCSFHARSRPISVGHLHTFPHQFNRLFNVSKSTIEFNQQLMNLNSSSAPLKRVEHVR